jgi:thiol-disulfide isomerase/thioredoxin
MLLTVALCATAHGAARQVAWIDAASDGDVDRAFAGARVEKKPLLLYWGASWCPPCNHLKSTLFNRHDFIERSRSFVAVQIDGDAPGAQKLGTRFGVRGYPTMVLFNPQGQEITRLPGAVDAPLAMDLLQLGLAGGRPVRQLLADARAGKTLSAGEWRALAFHEWEADEQLLPKAERPAVLLRLAVACPDPASARRLLIRGLIESAGSGTAKADDAMRGQVRAVLADPVAARAQMDLLTNYADELTLGLAWPAGAEREQFVAAYDAALQGLQSDAGLARADRLSALIGRLDLARLPPVPGAQPAAIPPALMQQMRMEAARADRETTDPYERQAVVTAAAYGLAQAGLWSDSDALLKANLARSHSPYYLMSQLASNARKQGHKAEAIAWYEQAYAKSVGPATRLQWGASYLEAVIDLTPQDAARIEQLAPAIFSEAATQRHAYYERSARSLQRIAAKLLQWNADGKHAALIDKLQRQLDGICGQLPPADPQRESCTGLLRAPAAKA